MTRLQSTLVSILILSLVTPAAAQQASLGLEPLPITRTADQQHAGALAAARIEPRRPDGTPHATKGWTLFLWIGPSLAREMSEAVHKTRSLDPSANLRVRMFGAGAHDAGAASFADPNCSCWADFDAKLTGKFSPAQVQAIMIQAPNVHSSDTDPEANAEQWHRNVLAILDIAHAKYPNLQVVYVMHGWYGGHDKLGRTPEPNGFHEDARTQLVQDTYGGPIPFVGGLSIWADGERPRYDGLTLTRSDVLTDGLHFTAAGAAKYGQRLWRTLKADPSARGWLWR
jgi:lysophospholipase L1-like esterase